MDVGRLRVLDTVARTGSVTAAATELHYAQASVSHHLARLQEEVGTPLVRRKGRGITLTPEGELLARRAREILRRIDEAQAEVGALSRQLRSRLRVAAFQSALLSLVPPALDRVRRVDPDVTLELQETHPDDAIALLRANEVDVAIIGRLDDEPPGDGLSGTKLYDDPIYLLSTTPEDSVAAHRDSNWIAGCERCRAGIEAVCLTAGYQPRIGLRTEDLNVQASFVAAGLGVITMPGLALRSLDMSRLEATPIPGMVRRVWAVVSGEPETVVVEEFLQGLRLSAPAR